MLDYNQEPCEVIKHKNKKICSFIKKNEDSNIDWVTVESFGDEWTKFNFFSDEEIEFHGDQYFDLVDTSMLNKNSHVLDIGCGTGRWTKYISSRCKHVEAVDPSHAVFTACELLDSTTNVRITKAEVDNIPFDDDSFDFVFSLGVLHHIPDTGAAMKAAVKKLKPGGYFLVYLYYSLDNRGLLFKSLFHLSNVFRNIVSRLPQKLKELTCDLIAYVVYLPLVGLTSLIKLITPKKEWYKKVPLSAYLGRSMHLIRTDALDRFGTRLEQRFSKEQIEKFMINSGLTDIVFSKNEPYWHAIGRK